MASKADRPAGQRPARKAAGKQPPAPRTKPSEVRRDELLDAAIKLFVAKGVGPTTVDEIAAGAGVAKGTFYLYFASKDDLLVALRERFIAGFLSRLREAVDACPPDDWTGRLRSWTRAGIDGYLEDYQLHDIVFHDYRPHKRRMKNENVVVSDLTAMLADGTAGGAWSADDPRLAAIVLFQGLHGAVDEAIEAGERNGEELAGRLSVMFLNLLRAREARKEIRGQFT